MANLKIDRRELHRRLARRWEVVAGLNRKGAALIEQALAEEPAPESIEDLRFLQTSFRVYQPLIEALEQLHVALNLRFAGHRRWRDGLMTALANARRAQQLADENFPHPIDPTGAEVGSLRKNARRLAESIDFWVKEGAQR
jgi:hypothetical protein